MQTVSFEHDYDAPIERVFDWLTTCANYGAGPLMFSGRLVRPGRDGGESVGALRRFRSAICWWREEITAYQRPDLFGYQVVWIFPPTRHHGATIELTDRGGITHVSWASTYSMPVPLIGFIFELLVLPFGKFYVRSMLETAAKALNH
ncbi:MAG TPA: SRPBCC family protein [Nocardioidaceae bacterium]|nr:SRPBCC family protein [Nocardioidaceae bacterium]